MTTAINDEDRRAAWTVFNYEREMYFALRDLVFPSRPSPLCKAANNAITESLVLHARNLCDMICDTTSFAPREIGSAHLMPGLPEDFVEARKALATAYFDGEHNNPSVPYFVFHHGLKPHLSRGENYDYSDHLQKIHEPLRWAMALIVAARASENIQAARAREEAERTNAAVEEAKQAAGMEVAAGDPMIANCESVQASAVELPRFVMFHDGNSGQIEWIDRNKVVSFGPVANAPNKTIINYSPGAWAIVRATTEEVAAKLEGRV